MLAPPPGLVGHRTRRIADELQSVMRHAVRNKLAAARNAAFFIKKKLATALESEPKAAQFLGIIDAELGAASELLSVAPTTTAAPLVVLEATRALLDELSVPRDVAIVVQGVDAPLTCDRADLQLAIYELLSNAVDAGARHITCAWSTTDAATVLTVTDDGVGVVDSSRARDGRLGLGLQVARRAVLLARGTVLVEPLLAGGTSARLSFQSR